MPRFSASNLNIRRVIEKKTFWTALRRLLMVIASSLAICFRTNILTQVLPKRVMAVKNAINKTQKNINLIKILRKSTAIYFKQFRISKLESSKILYPFESALKGTVSISLCF